ncbi:MAG: NTP transferase domain-containing protein [Kineosporiaceae bacterium]|nr:NTP transferase domain-containing protein [Kineosporiaceae bacterium]MBK7625403.1 NTP transferase domain-containing protein [Kineosporiaceae bacterium]
MVGSARGGAALAAAIAADTLEAVLGCARVHRVVVVTGETAAAEAAGRAGATVVAEQRPGAGLSAALDDALAAEIVSSHPGGVAVLLGDLPALRPADLAAGLDAARTALADGAVMAVIPDAEGRGSVLLAADRAGDLDPAFGPDSLAAHALRGARVLDLDLPRLRRDVDTPGELMAALTLGCGARTRAVLAAGPGYAGRVQATVHRFDPTSGAGSVLTDDGTVLPFTAEAFAGSGLRLLRIGQRLTVTVSGLGAQALVTGLRLGTVGQVPEHPARP